MIRTASFTNFKSLADVTLELGRLTVLVGANGAGKSSVLQALDMVSVSDLDETTVRRDLGPARDQPLIVMLSGTNVATFVVDFPEDTRPAAHYVVDGNRHAVNGASKESRRAFLREFGAGYLHPEADKLGAASPARLDPELGKGGENLASVLATIAGFDSDAFRAISAHLARLVPGARRVRVVSALVPVTETEVQVLDGQQIRRRVSRDEPGHRVEVQFEDQRWLPGELLSEGTLVALGLLTALHLPDPRPILLLDDVDRGLHIEAQTRLMEILRELLASDPELQIVATTHSPHLVNLCAADEVYVLALDEKRRTVARRLNEHPEFEKWRYGTQTGELWAALGQAWVVEPRA